MTRTRFLGAPLDALDMAGTLDALEAAIADGAPAAHLGLNAANLVRAHDDPAYRADLEAADVVTADGQSVVWGARLLGIPIPERVTGIDLMEALLDRCRERGWGVYLLGARPRTVAAVASALAGRGVTVAGYRDGYLGAGAWAAAAEAVVASGARVLFVGMPSPAKERFVIGHARAAGVPVSVGVGGSFDVLAGEVRRAPRLLQRAGAEWLFRLAQEPRRLVRRYTVDNARFAWMLARAALATRRPAHRARRAATGRATRAPAVAVGYQGFGNVGDEAILAGIEILLEGGPVVVETVVGGDRAPIPAFSSARRITGGRLLPGLRAAAALRRSKVMLLSGGGLLNDHWPVVVPRYLGWSVLARALGARIWWLGVGVGPLRRGWARALTRLTARLADVITVRDTESADLLGASARQARVVPDPAFFLEPRPHVGGGGLALIIRPPVPSQAGLDDRLVDALATLASSRGSVTILSMEAGFDDAFAARLADAVRDTTGTRPEVRALGLEPREALAELARYDEAVSVRLHGLILSAIAGTPCLPVVYDAKVAATAARLGLGTMAVPLPAVDVRRLIDGLDQVAADETRAEVARRLADLRAELAALRRLIETAVDG